MIAAHRNNINLAWSIRLLTLLYHAGVKTLCVAPGSRSAPLALAAEWLARQQADVQLHSHFDERGLGFFALGSIRVSGAPAVVITTSGTAVANLLPAMVEAHHSHLPLVVLTADRPNELLGCGANQAINQPAIFGTFATTTVAFTRVPEDSRVEEFDADWLAIAQALSSAHRTGPIHVNCPFRDPLYPDRFNGHQVADRRCDAWVAAWPTLPAPPVSTLPAVSGLSRSNSLVIIGNLPYPEAQRALTWAEQHQIPVIVDLVSGLRLASGPLLIPYPELLLASQSGQHWLNQFDQVIQFGGRLTGKRLNQWLAKGTQDYVIVSPLGESLDPSHRARTLVADVVGFCASNQPETTAPAFPGDLLTHLTQTVGEYIASPFSELTVVDTLCRWLPADAEVFAGNSLSIRWLDALAPGTKGQRTYSQRGASGIDGLIATAAGIAQSSRKPLVALLGDTSALHDLNSLALAAQCKTPLIVLINNNSGGGIFNLLPIAAFPSTHTQLFQCEHPWQFKQAAEMFHLAYCQPDNRKALGDALAAAVNRPGASIIECRFEPEAATRRYQQLLQAVEQ